MQWHPRPNHSASIKKSLDVLLITTADGMSFKNIFIRNKDIIT